MPVFFLFLLGLALGTLSTLFWIPEDDLGRGYFQMNALVVLGLLGLAVATYILHPFQPFGADAGWAAVLLYAALAAAFAYYGAVWRERWLWARAAALVSVLSCAGAFLACGRAVLQPLTELPHRSALLNVGLLTSALFLGWSLVTMLLGHWYLVAPKLTFRHLVIFCWVLLGLVLVRAATVGATVLFAQQVDPTVQPHPWHLLTGFDGQGMFFWFRLLWGLVIPLALAGMALHCARHQSNQSATGILYVLVVGSLIGEITALYLTITTGVPV